MKAHRLPQEGMVYEVIESFQQSIWSTIASGVTRFIKTFIETLLEDELTAIVSADRYERSQTPKADRNGHYQRYRK